MEIIDRHFLALPKEKKIFIFVVGIGFFLVALTAYNYRLTNLVESLLILVVGILYSESIKLNYRIQDLEKKRGTRTGLERLRRDGEQLGRPKGSKD